MQNLALTHSPSPRLAECELTHVERTRFDIRSALVQHANYQNALRQAGLDVNNYDFNLSFPDGCFVEDVAVVLDELIVLASPGAPSRRGETAAWKQELAKFRQVTELPERANLDGGDVLHWNRCLIVGHSSRTNAAGIEALAGLVRKHDYSVESIAIRSCLHLKTACTAVDDETLLVQPEFLDLRQLPRCRRLIAADAFGANILRLPDRILASAAHHRTLATLDEAGFQVHPIDISEFEKAEAGVTCLSLLLHQPKGEPRVRC